LSQALGGAAQKKGKEASRIDAYGTSGHEAEYDGLTVADLVNKVKQLSKKLLVEPPGTPTGAGAPLHQASRGLSKLSDIDSNFAVSRVSPRKENSAIGNTGHGAGQTSALAQFQTVNNHASTSTFRTKLDIEQCQEYESQLEQQREEADAIIGNLRKTQQELLNQIKGLELRLQEAQGNSLSMQQTPSLANIEPRARSELNGGRQDAYSELGREGSQRLQM
jgi:hypothetical protein